MSDLLMLIVIVMSSVGVAALILLLSEALIITLPGILQQAVKGNRLQLTPPLQRPTNQGKEKSCPFC